MARPFPRRALFSALASAPLVPGLAPAPDGAEGTPTPRHSAKIRLSCNLYSFNAPLRSGEMTLEQVIDFSASASGSTRSTPPATTFPATRSLRPTRTSTR